MWVLVAIVADDRAEASPLDGERAAHERGGVGVYGEYVAVANGARSLWRAYEAGDLHAGQGRDLSRQRHRFDCRPQVVGNVVLRADQDLAALGNRRFVRIAGLGTCRQRPGSASGVLFLTLEDETGNTNVVVWSAIQERFRTVLLKSPMVTVTGTVEISPEGIVHLMAGRLDDTSDALNELIVRSRDFK